jgi:thiamine kinase-like enzyme
MFKALLFMGGLFCCQSGFSMEEKSPHNERIETYHKVSSEIENLSSEEIRTLIQKGQKIPFSSVTLIEIKGTPVIVKKLSLKEIEKNYINEKEIKSENLSEIFPLSSHPEATLKKFRALREVYSQEMMTDWVFNEQCENFPLMYKTRLEIIPEKPYEFLVFMEYIPLSLREWLDQKWEEWSEKNFEGNKIDIVLKRVEQTLLETIEFMNSKRMYHLDLHFDNIRTDEQKIFLIDFGGALSRFCVQN